MAKLIYGDIPINFQQYAEEFAASQIVRDYLNEVEECGSDPDLKVELTYEGSGNGNVLFYFGYFDYWALRTESGQWFRAYIGYTEEYEQTVLIAKNCMQVFKSNINAFNEVLPVYIDRPIS